MIDLTSVCPKYQGKGLATKMTETLIEEAKRRKYPLVVSETTNAYLQRNKMVKLGFESVEEFEFSDLFRSYSSMPEDVAKIHSKAVVLVKELK